jgi:hypothetical protein
MRWLDCAAAAAACFAVAALAAAPARAQTRVFVAAQGSDANPCTFALPCRTFQHAHDTVAAGGEIDVLDPAGYGALTISKAISIQGHGFSGVTVPFVGTGITINAGATDAVSLNGLLVEGAGSGMNGILFNSGKSLVMTNCVVRNVANIGLFFGASATTAQTLSIVDSYFTDNSYGVTVNTFSSGPVRASIERTAFYGQKAGAALGVFGGGGTGPLDVTMTHGIVANNTGGSPATVGVAAQSGAGQSVTTATLIRVTLAGNDLGLQTTANATVRIAQSTVTGNTHGYEVNGGAIVSYGDNYIDGNGSNIGSLGSATKQ